MKSLLVNNKRNINITPNVLKSLMYLKNVERVRIESTFHGKCCVVWTLLVTFLSVRIT